MVTPVSRGGSGVEFLEEFVELRLERVGHQTWLGEQISVSGDTTLPL